MILTIFYLACIVLILASIKKSAQLQKEYGMIQKRVMDLKETVEINRRSLRQKLNRDLILQKQSVNEAIPTVNYQKLGKTIQVLLSTDTIYTLAEDEGFGLSGTCEGNGDCGLCAMVVVTGEENLSPINEVEKEILNKLDYPLGTRLSCQARIQGDVTLNFLDAEGQT